MIAEEAGTDNVDVTMGYAGANPPNFAINMAYLWSRGPDDSLLRVALREGSKVDIFELQERLRKALPAKVGAWFRTELLRLGLTAEQADQRVGRHDFRFRARRPDLRNDESGSTRADRGRGQRPQPRRSEHVHGQASGAVRRDRLVARRPDPAVAALPDGAGHARPRASRLERGDRPRHRRIIDRRHLLEPLHDADLLARRSQRQFVPGAGAGAAAQDDRSDRRRACAAAYREPAAIGPRRPRERPPRPSRRS